MDVLPIPPAPQQQLRLHRPAEHPYQRENNEDGAVVPRGSLASTAEHTPPNPPSPVKQRKAKNLLNGAVESLKRVLKFLCFSANVCMKADRVEYAFLVAFR
jgi:hypothetical protein